MIFKYCVWPEASKEDPNGKALVNGSAVQLKPLSAGRSLTENLLGCCPCAFRFRRPIGVETGPQAELTLENAEPTPVIALKLACTAEPIDKDAGDEETDSSSERGRALPARTFSGSGSTYRGEAPGLQTQDLVERSSMSSSFSNRSAASSRKQRSIQTRSSHAENEKPGAARNSPQRSRARSFDVITARSERSQVDGLEASDIRAAGPGPGTPPPSPTRTEIEEPPSSSGSEGRAAQSTASSVDSREVRSKALERRLSELSLGTSALRSNGCPEDSASPTPGSEAALSSPARSTASLEGPQRLSERRLTLPQLTRNGIGDEAERRSRSVSPKGEDDVAFETLDFRNSAEKVANLYDNADCNVTLYSSSSIHVSPKASKRFVNEELQSKDTDSDRNSPLPIGFDGVNGTEGSYASDDSDDASLKPQPSRLPTPVDLPKRWNKMSPCIMRPQIHCQRSTCITTSRHSDKHQEKSSKAVQQCFSQLESKDWEVTLKGLRALTQIARDDPEQLDVCAPGVLARVLAKHIKNLRSQVARVACSAAAEIFSAHVRGIDQDLDEVAGPLLHRTADTNRFLREDCNVALNSMIEHVSPHRTIMTVANRGAKHQNTVVHATTARLFNVIVIEIGGENIMNMPRDVKDKLFATNAKLLTDGNLQARKHAKETFRLLSRCDGFRKALTDAVPESTLRLIDKTLRTL